METKGTHVRIEPQASIAYDSEFYKYIFKKTEKICCAVFYIVRADAEKGHDDTVISDLEDTATMLLDVSLESLRSDSAHADIFAKEIRYALVALESRLKIAHAARLLREGYLEVFLHEIDAVGRSLNKYTERSDRNPLFTTGEYEGAKRTESRPRERRTREISFEGAEGQPVGIAPRRDRILAVIKDKNEATIKDIAEVVTDCSEKTIQRDLIDLIKDGVIVREGERRWSKYKLV